MTFLVIGFIIIIILIVLQRLRFRFMKKKAARAEMDAYQAHLKHVMDIERKSKSYKRK